MAFSHVAAFYWGLCLLQALAPPAYGVNIEAVFEQSCDASKGFVTQDFENWIAAKNVTRLFFPMLSDLDALRITQSLFKTTDISNIRQRDVDLSCLEVKPGATEFVFSGFCGHTNTKTLTMTEPKVFTAPPTFDGDVTTTLRVSLSNNKDWQVMEVCWGDGQRSFAVLSSKQSLSTCDQKIIASHLKAIGYKPEFFRFLRYEHCAFVCGSQATATGLASTFLGGPMFRSRF